MSTSLTRQSGASVEGSAFDQINPRVDSLKRRSPKRLSRKLRRMAKRLLQMADAVEGQDAADGKAVRQ